VVFFNSTVNSDANGEFLLVAPPAGSYRVRVKHAQALASALEFIMDATSQTINIGTLPTGDVDNNNVVNVTDFALVAVAFGKVSGQVGYDIRADLNADAVINITDFSFLALNFGQAGAP